MGSLWLVYSCTWGPAIARRQEALQRNDSSSLPTVSRLFSEELRECEQRGCRERAVSGQLSVGDFASSAHTQPDFPGACSEFTVRKLLGVGQKDPH